MTAELVFGWMCAFLIGYAINQGGTCGVAAARDLVHHRRIDRFAGFAVASGAAGVVCLPAAWALGLDSHLGGMAAIAPPLIIGAVLLGLGTVLNDACLLGSLWRLGNGEVRLLALPAGLALGFAVAAAIPGIAPSVVHTPLQHLGVPEITIIGVSGAILIAALLVLRRLPRRDPDRWPMAVAMTLLGVSGALLYVLQPGWSYADAVRRGVTPVTAMMMTGWGGAIAAMLTVAGAATSAIRLKVFRPARPRMTAVLRSFGGGVLIALGASMIPGGNDTLLLASVPAGSVSAAIAFTVMTFVVIATVALLKRLDPGRMLPTVD